MLHVWPIGVFADNYVWVLEREDCRRVAIVDPGDGGPVIAGLQDRGLEVAAVLLTHNHSDHVGGLSEIIQSFQPDIYGSAADGIPGVTHPVTGGDTITIPDLDLELEVLPLPGHTANHLGFVFAGSAFVGDTLFAGGCGRVFEGTMEQMYNSLQRLAALPGATKTYCAHEYTVANLRFAREVEPENARLEDRLRAAKAAREADQPTVPSTISYELETNVFLRCGEPAVRAAAETHAGRSLEPGADVFSVVRSWKDGWSG